MSNLLSVSNKNRLACVEINIILLSHKSDQNKIAPNVITYEEKNRLIQCGKKLREKYTGNANLGTSIYQNINLLKT